jgi:hypothetical protein
MANVSIGGIGFDLRAYGGKFSKDVQKAMGKVGKQISAFGGKMRNAGAGMTAGLTLPLVAFGVQATKTFASFEQEMAKVKAVSGATGAEFASLEAEAKRLGGSTRFAASEVANLQLEYSKLGFKPAEINAATEATLALAQASGSDLAESAAVAGGTLRGFQLEASEMGRVTDVMAKSFSSSALDLSKFRESMKFVAPVAKAANVSLEESSALLSVLGDNMVSGSQAGTALRRIMSEMAKTGKPFSQALDEISQKGIGLVDAQDEVGRSAQTALLILAENRDKVKALTDTYRDAGGSAKAMAEIMDATTAGAGKRLSSAFESLQIAVGGLLAKYVTPLIDKLAVWVGKFSQLDEGTQGMIVKAGLFAAALGPIVAGIGAVLAILPAFVSGVSIVGGVISAPVLAAVAAVGAAMYLVIQHKDAIVATITNLVNTAREWFNQWKANNSETLARLSEAWNTFKTTFTALFTAIGGAVVRTTQAIVGKLNEWLAPIGGLQGAFEIFATVVTEVFTGVFNFLSDIFSQIAEVLNSGGTAWETFSGIVLAVVTKIGEAFGKLVGFAWEGIKAMKDAFLEFDWGSLGKAIIDGIVAGLKNGGKLLKDATVGMVKGAYEGAKDFLGIRSPSRLFREMGGFTAQGLAQGIEGGRGDAEKAASLLGRSAVDGAAKELSKFASIGGQAEGTFDSLFGKLKSGLQDGKLDFKEWASIAGDAVKGLSKAFGGAGNGKGGLLGSIGQVLGALGGSGGTGQGTGGIGQAISSIAGLFGGSGAGTGNSGGSGGGSTLSSIVGLASTIGGFFADGGRPPLGRVSVVGEEGPELFVPDTAGTVVPNSALQMAGGGSAPNVTVNNNFTAGVTRAELASVLPQLQKNVMKGVVEGVQRGGAFRTAIQS